MNKKEDIKNELNEISPFLSDLNKDRKEGFSLPNNYFENFEDRLMSRIKEENALIGSTKTDDSDISFISWLLKAVELLFTPKYAVPFATAVVLVVFGFQFFGKAASVNMDEPSLIAQLSVEETNSFILNNIEDFSIDDIIELVEADAIEDIHIDLPSLHHENLNNKQTINTEKDNESAFDKALESADAINLLDDLSDDDFEEDYEEGYF
jgi:hypothetical protein